MIFVCTELCTRRCRLRIVCLLYGYTRCTVIPDYEWYLCHTGTGKTVAENLSTYPSLSELSQTVVYPVAEPFSAAGNHITVISGSLAPESALIKLSGKSMKTFEGPAQVYDGEQKAFEAIIR